MSIVVAVVESVNAINTIIDALTSFMPKVIAFASLTAAFMPPANGDGLWSKIHSIINMLACNFRNATNAPVVVSDDD